MKTFVLFFGILILNVQIMMAQVKLGIIDLTHTHVHWILGRPADEKIIITGIVETTKELVQR